jgi:hypothetical protein
MSPTKSEEAFSEAETEHRRETALKRMLNTPHTPHSQKTKAAPSPRKASTPKATKEQSDD